MAERADDEVDVVGEDNSVGRSVHGFVRRGVRDRDDPLALDLRVPDRGRDASDGAIRHALAQQRPSYLSYLLSFYVVGCTGCGTTGRCVS